MSVSAGASTGVSHSARIAAALAGASFVAVVLNALVAAAAVGFGADGRFDPLHPKSYTLWPVGGMAIAAIGWVAIRRWAPSPATALRWAVPGGLLVSLVPDVLLLVTPFEAYTTGSGGVALMVMHAVVAVVSVLVLARAFPLPHRR